MKLSGDIHIKVDLDLVPTPNELTAMMAMFVFSGAVPKGLEPAMLAFLARHVSANPAPHGDGLNGFEEEEKLEVS